MSACFAASAKGTYAADTNSTPAPNVCEIRLEIAERLRAALADLTLR